MTHAATRHHAKGPDPTPNNTVLQEKNPPIAAPDKYGLSDAITCSCLNASLKSSARKSKPSSLVLFSEQRLDPLHSIFQPGQDQPFENVTLEFVPSRLMS